MTRRSPSSSAALALYAVVDVRLVEVDHENRYGYDTCDATEATGAACGRTSRRVRCSATRR